MLKLAYYSFPDYATRIIRNIGRKIRNPYTIKAEKCGDLYIIGTKIAL